jgi:hypothetical protein
MFYGGHGVDEVFFFFPYFSPFCLWESMGAAAGDSVVIFIIFDTGRFFSSSFSPLFACCRGDCQPPYHIPT